MTTNESRMNKRRMDRTTLSTLMDKLEQNIQKEKSTFIQPLSPLDAMRIRAESAEIALDVSEKAFVAVNLLLTNSHATIQESDIAMIALKKIIHQSDDSLANKESALQSLTNINQNNIASMQASAIALSALNELAFNDPLTNLPNRRLLKDRLERAFINNSRNHSYGAVVFFDIDKFKRLNDQYGHESGDMLLIEVAQRLKVCIRESDTVARYGGDEFVILLCDLNQDLQVARTEAANIAEDILASLSAPYAIQVKNKATHTSIEYQSFVSIGVAMFGDDESEKISILDWADEAMYWAKHDGGRTIRFYDLLKSTEKTLASLYLLATTNDIETAEHGIRTSEYVKILAQRTLLMNLYPGELSDALIERMRKTTQLHDIGKTQIPYAVIHKNAKLLPTEWALMKTHPTIGESILENTKKQNHHLEAFLNTAIDIAVAHHECWDGTGYPNALSGTDIPLAGRIMAIADVYDALISARSYKKKWTHEDACQQIIANAGTQFDPLLIEAFICESEAFKAVADKNRDH